MKKTLAEIWKDQDCPFVCVKFDAMIGERKYQFLNPVTSINPGWDYQLMIVPYEKRRLNKNKAVIRYFKKEFLFNVCE